MIGKRKGWHVALLLVAVLLTVGLLSMVSVAEEPEVELKEARYHTNMDLTRDVLTSAEHGSLPDGVCVELEVNAHAFYDPNSQFMPAESDAEVSTGPTGTGVMTSYEGSAIVFESAMYGEDTSVKHTVEITNPTSVEITYFVTYRMVIPDDVSHVDIGGQTMAMDDPFIVASPKKDLANSFDTASYYDLLDEEAPSGTQVDSTELSFNDIGFDWSDLVHTSYEPHGRFVEYSDGIAFEVTVETTVAPFASALLDPTYELSGDSDVVMYGAFAGYEVGHTMARGDIDDDGYEDILIGAPMGANLDGTKNTAGQVYAIFGMGQTTFDPHMDLDNQADVTMYGGGEGDMLGTALACGDIDNDGSDDIVLGIPYADGASDGRRDSGEVIILWGGTTDQIGAHVDLDVSGDVKIYGANQSDNLGYCIDVGDVDDDGFDDIIIGAPGGDGPTDTALSTGEVYIVYGDTRINMGSSIDLGSATGPSIIYGLEKGQLFGQTVMIADLDDDSYAEMIATSPSYNQSKGVAYMFWGSASPLATMQASSADVVLDGRGYETLSFHALAAGDIDNDGTGDLVVSAPFADGASDDEPRAGEVYVVLGQAQGAWPTSLDMSSADITLYAKDANDRVGWDLDVGYANVDLYADIIIGSPHVDANFNSRDEAGETYLVHGNTLANMGATLDLEADSNVTLYGANDGDKSGHSVLIADMDGDLKGDMVVGHPGTNGKLDDLDDAGGVSIKFTGAAVDVIVYGVDISDRLGYQVATGDLDDDGYEDLVVSAPYADGFNDGITADRPNCGEVYIVWGDDRIGLQSIYDLQSDVDVTIYGENFYNPVRGGMSIDNLGKSLAIGDVNNDGHDDLLMGAPTYYNDGDFRQEWRASAGAFFFLYGRSRAAWGTMKDLRVDNDIYIIGEATDSAGVDCAIANVDGDSYNDIIMSVYKSDGISDQDYDCGEIDIIFGSNTLLSWYDLAEDALLGPTPDVRITGPGPRYNIGYSLDVGYIDSDSYADILTGGPNAKVSALSRLGSAFVITGRSSWPATLKLDTNADLYIYGENPYDHAGKCVELCDLDGDGADDIVVSMPQADGPYNMRDECGEIHVLYGSDSLLDGSSYTLKEGESDLIIYGSHSYEWAGTSLGSGFINSDSYEDLLIGSPFFDSVGDGFLDNGAVTLLHGNTRAILGEKRDLAACFQFYGEDNFDKFGYFVGTGNFDNDGYDDILVGATSGYGPRNMRSMCGEAYVLYGNDNVPEPLSIESLTLVNGGSTISTRAYDKKTCFANSEAYTFRVNATNTVGLTDINTVEINLDPSDLNISYRWERATGLMYEVPGSDPNNYCSLVTTVDDVTDDIIDTYHIRFNVLFDYTFPKEDLISVRSRVECTVAGNVFNTYGNFFRVENDMEIRGVPRVYDEDMVELEEGDWVRGGENLTWTNVMVTYEDSFVTPSVDDFDVGVKGPDGVTYINTSADPNNIRVVNTVEMNNDPDAMFTMEILNIPTNGKDQSEVGLGLAIDTDGPAAPANFLVHADSEFDLETQFDNDKDVYLTWEQVTDVGSGVLGYYAAYNDSEPVSLTSSGAMFTVSENGNSTFYVRARDVAGNWGEVSQANIIVDRLTVDFTDPFPADVEWLNYSSIECSIAIVDKGGSGVDADNIQYQISLAGPTNYYSWITLPTDGYGNLTVTPKVEILFAQGVNNYIKWRAQDLAGNGYEESDDMVVRIDSVEPTFKDPTPFDNVWGPASTVSCSVTVEDLMSGVNGTLIQYRYSKTGLDGFGNWMMAPTTSTGTKAYPAVVVEFEPGDDNYIQWRAWDEAMNLGISEPYPVLVDDTPPVFDTLLPNASEVSNTTSVTCTARLTDLSGSGVDINSVEYSISTYNSWLTAGIGIAGYGDWTSKNLEFTSYSNYQYVTANVTLDFLDGDYNYIRWRAKDLAGNGYIESTNVQVRTMSIEENFAPTSRISAPSHGADYDEGDTIYFNGTASEDKNGDALYFYWESDIDGPLSVNSSFDHSGLSRGTHRITLWVTDGMAGHNASSYVIISVIRSAVSTDGGDGGSDGGSGGEEQNVSDDPDNDDQLADEPLLDNGLGIDFKDIVIFVLATFLIFAVVFGMVAKKRREQVQEMELASLEAKWENFLQGSESSRRTIVCPNCRSDIPEFSEYCAVCGHTFQRPPPAEQVTMGQVAPQQTNIPPPPAPIMDRTPPPPAVEDVPAEEEEPPQTWETEEEDDDILGIGDMDEFDDDYDDDELDYEEPEAPEEPPEEEYDDDFEEPEFEDPEEADFEDDDFDEPAEEPEFDDPFGSDDPPDLEDGDPQDDELDFDDDDLDDELSWD